jgi:hypothetical protein
MKTLYFVFLCLISTSAFSAENIIDCNEGRFHIIVNQIDDNNYSYLAYDQKVDNSQASLILNDGTYLVGKHTESFIFKNNFYKYQIIRAFDGAGGEIDLIVTHFGKEIYREVCKKSSFNDPATETN